MKFKMIVVTLLLFLVSCGASAPSSTSGKLDLSVDWSQSGTSQSVAKYSEMIFARASCASLEPVETNASEDGVYHFDLGTVPAGKIPLMIEFLYEGALIGAVETFVEFGEVGSLQININAIDIVPPEGALSVASLIMDISPLASNDADADGISDLDETAIGTDPLDADSDDDNIADGAEVSIGTDPLAADSDADGAPDSSDHFPLDAGEWYDSDDDGIGDNADNCKMAPNEDQEDADKDGVGNVCADDDDADGLKDADESAYGTDPQKPDTDGDGLSDPAEIVLGLDPLSADSDDDLIVDSIDKFPLDPNESGDFDLDGVGDAKDNCRYVANADQKNSDKEYFEAGRSTPSGAAVVSDDAGDLCDDDFDGDGENAIYVWAAAPVNSSLGSFCEPVSSLAAGVDLAAKLGAAVKVAAGVYDVRDVDFAKANVVSGGFNSDFSQRSAQNESAIFKTSLINAASSVALNIHGLSSPLEMSGFYISAGTLEEDVGGLLPDGGEFSCSNAALLVAGSHLIVSDSVFDGAADGAASCGIVALGDAKLEAKNIVVRGNGGAASARSAGIVGQDATLHVSDSVISAGRGKHATAIVSDVAHTTFINNVIDGSSKSLSPKSAVGIKFLGGSLTLSSNKIFTRLAPEQLLLSCLGRSPTNAAIIGNTFATFSSGSSGGLNAILFDCEGELKTMNEFAADQSAVCFGGFECAGNLPYTGDPNGLFADLFGIL